MLTNKEIAITRLVDARMHGYNHLMVTRSIKKDIVYLIAYNNIPKTFTKNLTFNICALKRDPLGHFLRETLGPGFLGFGDGIPIKYGPEIVDKYYHFLTYNQ